MRTEGGELVDRWTGASRPGCNTWEPISAAASPVEWKYPTGSQGDQSQSLEQLAGSLVGVSRRSVSWLVVYDELASKQPAGCCISPT